MQMCQSKLMLKVYDLVIILQQGKQVAKKVVRKQITVHTKNTET